MDDPGQWRQHNERACQRRVEYLNTDDYRENRKNEGRSGQGDSNNRVLIQTYRGVGLNPGLLDYKLCRGLFCERHNYKCLVKMNIYSDGRLITDCCTFEAMDSVGIFVGLSGSVSNHSEENSKILSEDSSSHLGCLYNLGARNCLCCKPFSIQG